MSLQKINTRTLVLILMIVAAAAMRFVSYKFPYVLSNFTPVGAIALFGGAYFTDKWKAYVVVLITLFASDILIDYLYTSKWVLWYSGAIWVYLAFAIMVLIGSFIKKANVANVGIASLASVMVHWLLTDIPSVGSTLYPHTLAGYGQSLIAAIPFERNMVLGDMLFCAILFGGFELAKNKYTILRSQKELAL
ncbi:MAG TPA: DUF6580 family putative transport protein [Mucilaginibacter sp.]|jgi:hypothetical protein